MIRVFSCILAPSGLACRTMLSEETSSTMDQDANKTAEVRRLPTLSNLGVVVIGRNEGHRLITCLDSLSDALTVIYVDSGSTDRSVQAAQDRGIHVVELDLSIPFT